MSFVSPPFVPNQWYVPLRRLILGVVRGVLWLFIGATLAVCVLLLRLFQGPIDLDRFSSQIRENIASLAGEGVTAHTSSIMLEWVDGSVHVAARDLVLARIDDVALAASPQVSIGIDPYALLQGRIAARSLTLHTPVVYLALSAQGQLSLAQRRFSTDETQQTSIDLLPAHGLLTPDFLKALASGNSTPDGDMPTLNLHHVTIHLLYEASGRIVSFKPFDVQIKQSDGAVEAKISSQGRSGLWSLAARMARGSGEQDVAIAVRNLDLGEITQGEISQEAREKPTAALQLDLKGVINAPHLRMNGTLTVQKGQIHVADEVLDIPATKLNLTIDTAARALDIDASPIVLPNLAGVLSGRIMFADAADPTHPVRIQMMLDNLELEAARVKNETAQKIVFSGVYETPTRVLWVDRAAVLGRQSAHAEKAGAGADAPAAAMLEARGSVTFIGETPAVQMSGTAQGQNAAAVRALWPPFLSPKIRSWVLANVLEAQVNHADFALALPPGVMLEGRLLSRDMFGMTMQLSAASVRVAPDLPPITGVDVTLKATGVSAHIEGRNGRVSVQGHDVQVPTLGFQLEDLYIKDEGTADALVLGSAAALLALAETHGVSVSKGVGFDPKALSGEGLARISVLVPLKKDTKITDYKVSVDGEFRQISGKGLIDGHDLDKAAFKIKAQGRHFSAEGSGLVGGAPFRLFAVQETPSKFILKAETDADDAQRAKLGMDFGSFITGSTLVRFVREANGAQVVRRVEMDLTQAKINLPMVAFEKPKGQAASLSFQPVVAAKANSKAVTLEDLSLQGKGWGAKGRLKLADTGQFQSLDLTDVKLRPTDQVNVHVEYEKERYVVRINGKSLDVRPMMSRLLSADTKDAGQQKTDLQLRCERVQGANDVEMSDVRLDMQKTGARMTAFVLSAAFGGGGRITGEILEDQGRPYLFVSSTDGGRTLRFIDLYKRMVGGRLTATQTLGAPENPADGVLFVESFRVVNDPAMQRLFGEATQIQDAQAPPEARAGKINPSDVSFDRLRVAFTKAQGQMHIREGVLRNAASGITFEGQMDWRRDRMDLKGTFIPAFALNNLLARVPVVGALLGGQNEGVLGITYAVTGSMANPTLRVNPMSAIAPGFLRGLFQFPDPQAPDLSGTRRRVSPDAGSESR